MVLMWVFIHEGQPDGIPGPRPRHTLFSIKPVYQCCINISISLSFSEDMWKCFCKWIQQLERSQVTQTGSGPDWSAAPVLTLCFLKVTQRTDKNQRQRERDRKTSVPHWGVFHPRPASACLLLVEGQSAGRRRGVASAESLQEETVGHQRGSDGTKLTAVTCSKSTVFPSEAWRSTSTSCGNTLSTKYFPPGKQHCAHINQRLTQQ